MLVVQPIYAHYRFGLLDELARHTEWDFEFFAGDKGHGAQVELFSPHRLPRARLSTNRWVGKFLWQSGLLGSILRDRPVALILPGGAHYVSSWVAAVIARALGARVMFWTAGWHRPDRGIRRIVRVLFYHSANHLLLYNSRAKEIGISMGYPRHRMTVVYNSQKSPPSGRPVRNQEISFPQGPGGLVLAVARLTPVKRFDLLVDAAARLRNTATPVRLLILGDGPELPSLSARARRSKVNASFVGAVYDERVIKSAYERALVTVVPGAVGLTAVQSLENGTPVISHSNADSQMAEWEAIRPGLTGDHFRQGDARDLAAVLERWMRKTDRELREIREHCRHEFDARWRPDAHAARIVEALNELFKD